MEVKSWKTNIWKEKAWQKWKFSKSLWRYAGREDINVPWNHFLLFSYSKSNLLASLASHIFKPYTEYLHLTTSADTFLAQATVLFAITFQLFSLVLPFALSIAPHPLSPQNKKRHLSDLVMIILIFITLYLSNNFPSQNKTKQKQKNPKTFHLT